MEKRIGLLLALGLGFGPGFGPGFGLGCGGTPLDPGANLGFDAGPPCKGVCPPVLVGKLLLRPNKDGPGAIFLNMSVDRNRKLLYGNGVRVDVANPRAMKLTTLPKTGPVVVDPATGRYATGEYPGYGTDNDTLFVFNPNNTLYDSQPLRGVVSAVEVDAATGRFFATASEEGALLIYSESSRAVLMTYWVGSSSHLVPIFDPSSGKLFVNLSFQLEGPTGHVYHFPWVLNADNSTDTLENEQILAVDGVRNLAYLGVDAADGSSQNRLEVRDSASWALAGTQIDVDAYWVGPDPALNRLYVRRLHDVAVFDQTTGAYLTQLPLADDFILENIAFAPGDDRIYVVGWEQPGAPPVSPREVLLVFATR